MGSFVVKQTPNIKYTNNLTTMKANINTAGLEQLLSEKKELVRLFLIAAILAFSVGALGSLFVEQAIIPRESVMVISLLLVFISFALLAKDITSQLSFTDEFEAMVFFDRKRNKIIPVRDYAFSEHCLRTVEAIKAESKVMRGEWEKYPLLPKEPVHENSIEMPNGKEISYVSICKVDFDPEEHQKPKSALLLEEVASFVILEELSLHLSSYFNNTQEDKFIKEYKREDIPEFLLKNRVLNLLSTPLEQRDIFLDAYPDGKGKPDGEICSLWGSDGSLYSRFDLVLPKGTNIKHGRQGAIRIETARLSLEISAEYTGFSGVVSESFCTNYLRKDDDAVSPLQFVITLNGRINPLSLLWSTGWQYYRWLDSFRDRLKKSFDFQAFQNEIHWSMIEPLLFSIQGLRKSESRSASATTSSTEQQ